MKWFFFCNEVVPSLGKGSYLKAGSGFDSKQGGRMVKTSVAWIPFSGLEIVFKFLAPKEKQSGLAQLLSSWVTSEVNLSGSIFPIYKMGITMKPHQRNIQRFDYLIHAKQWAQGLAQRKLTVWRWLWSSWGTIFYWARTARPKIPCASHTSSHSVLKATSQGVISISGRRGLRSRELQQIPK